MRSSAASSQLRYGVQRAVSRFRKSCWTPEKKRYRSHKTSLDRGMKIFDAQCATCHSNQEMIAKNETVNLTDKKWKHGGKVADIEKTIREGVSDTEMLPLKDKLLPREIRAVARYVLYLNYGKEAGK